MIYLRYCRPLNVCAFSDALFVNRVAVSSTYAAIERSNFVSALRFFLPSGAIIYLRYRRVLKVFAFSASVVVHQVTLSSTYVTIARFVIVHALLLLLVTKCRYRQYTLPSSA